MEERSRLGRGLEEVSQFYLSDRPREKEGKTEKSEPKPAERHAVRVFHPGSPLLKSVFLANLALEVARNQYRVTLWDAPREDCPGIASMMGGLVLPGLHPEAGTVRLYGLPDILLYNAADHEPGKLVELSSAPAAFDGRSILLVNAPESLEGIVEETLPFDTILMSALDERSLLRSYAFIKVILEHNPASSIRIVFEKQEQGADIHETFSRLAAFVKEKLSGEITLLGVFEHDEVLARSIEEKRPLVLWHEPSPAKESIRSLSEAFMKSGRRSQLEVSHT